MLLNFVDADIPAVLRVLAKFTGKQFLVDPRVKGTLTLVSGPVAPDAAYGMLLGALRMQGYAAVDVAGGTRVMPEADAKLQGGPVQSADAPAGGGVVTRTFRLSYENATALVPVLRPMIAPSNSITAYPANNTLVITDYADNLDRIGRIIASIDNPSSLVTEVVKVRQGIAVDIAGMASELLDAQRNEDPSQRVVVVADPRANSVIVRSGSPGRAKLARDLIRQLDSSQTDPDNLHVVYLRNAQATHLARVLRGVLTGESDGGGAGGDAAARAALGRAGPSAAAWATARAMPTASRRIRLEPALPAPGRTMARVPAPVAATTAGARTRSDPAPPAAGRTAPHSRPMASR